MKKELTCNAGQFTAQRSFALLSPKRIANNILNFVETSLPVVRLSAYYSKLLEEPVSPRRTLHFVNAQVSAFTLLCASGTASVALIALAIWTVTAIYGCRKK